MSATTGKGSAVYTEAQARRWLSWLARYMLQSAQTVFLIEQLQPSGLAAGRQRWAYLLASRAFWGLWVGSVAGLVLASTLTERYGETLIAGLIVGLGAGLLAALVDGWRWTQRPDRPVASPSTRVGRLLRLLGRLLISVVQVGLASMLVGTLVFYGAGYWWSVLLGLFGGSVVVLVGALGSRGCRPSKGGLAWLLCWGFARRLLVSWLAGGTLGALLMWLRGGYDGPHVGAVIALVGGPLWMARSLQRSPKNEIQTVETLTWSWAKARGSGCTGLVVGPISGLLLGLVVGLGWNLAYRTPIGEWYLGVWAGAGSGGGAVVGLLGYVFGGLRSGVRELKTRPNQGIRLSIRNGLLAGILAALAAGSLIGLRFGWANAFAYGPWVGLWAGLWFGGMDALQHGILRLVLYWSGDAPLDYARFLDAAADELGFLQKVGGGYIFVHRYLLEYFAALGEDTGTVQESIPAISTARH